MIQCISDEIVIQSEYLGVDSIDTIYFGGGTPSLLTEGQLTTVLTIIHDTFEVSQQPEITLEANPDDLTIQKLNMLKKAGINRLSIGVQSFNKSHLNYLNRIHSNEEAIKCVTDAQNIGFDNISIDLIYGIPSDSHDIWINDITTAIELDVAHISTYCLTIEDSTVFGNWLKKGKIKQVEDEFSAHQFELLIDMLNKAGLEQYEVSNFAKPEMLSKHNTSYWQQTPYLGIGPGAHSYNGVSRQYNISNNPKYIKAINEKKVPFTVDELNKFDLINERILISLRTKWGLDILKLKTELDYDLLLRRKTYLKHLEENKLATLKDGKLILTIQGKLLADHISSELFVE